MRILVLNQYYWPDGASSAQLLTELCEDLAEHHDVTIVTGRPSYNISEDQPKRRGLLSRERRSGVKLLRVWSTSFPRQSMPGRVANYLTFLTTAILGALRAPKPDVIMTWTDPPPIAAVGALVGRLRGAPFVLSCQDIVPESVVAAGELSNPVMIKVLSASARAGFRGATSVISIGRDMDERLVDLGVPRAKITTIRNWADGALVKPLDGPNPFRSDHGWDDRFVVMHSGNLGMGQDLDGLIEAADLLRGDPDILIALVGEGIRKERYQAEVARRGLTNVEFLPFQPKSELAYSLGAADVQVVAHRRGMEGYQVPSKLYGMLAIGEPCLAAVVEDSEVAATIREADCGLVVAPDDPEAIAQAIRTLRDEAGSTDRGQSARKAFEQRHDRPIATGAYRALLEAVAERSRP